MIGSRIAVSYLAFSGMLGLAILLMKMVAAVHGLGSLAATDF